MPPSPALRYSPGRELHSDNHKRGRSLEGGLLFKEKDDDLALFNEMQSRERESFLLQTDDDLEDTFSSKLRHFSDYKLGISIPARGESSELLNGDGEKNDYDWLITPPDTPLFPSLDDEPSLITAPSRGRPRSQPITISRSSTMEKSYRSSRGSASPNRLSSSPRSVNSMSQSRGRPSSAHRSSPTPSQRSATPTRRPSPPPSKPSTSAPSGSTRTPTPRRSSVSGTRGTSPIRTARGNSVSPKIRAWQSNIPGFSSEVPPNLRTSLADRPASYVRGSSPASRNGRDSGSKFGRQSMSPTASRSISSSHSQDRDRISSHSKGSVASSGDDDVDSLQSVHVGSLERLAPKRIGAFTNNRAAALSKKSTRILSPSSAPKRSFDSALRQMDHRKSPQNMFRPLLSSVPSSTFYAGKGSSVSRTLISRNSSVTTSSNTSSDHGTGVAIDIEGSDHQHDDMVTENENATDPDIHEEIFPFDKGDILKKDVGHEIDDGSLHSRLSGIYRDPAIECEPGYDAEFSHHDVRVEISSTSDALHVRADNSEVDSLENMKVCSRCGCRYHVAETAEVDIDLCPDCYREEKLLVAVGTKKTTIGTAESSLEPRTFLPDEFRASDEPESQVVASEMLSNVIDNDADAKVFLHGDNGGPHHDENHTYHEESSFSGPVMEANEGMVSLQDGGQPALDNCPTDNGIGSEQLMPTNNYPNLRSDVSEVAGISVLLTRSSSSKGPVVQGRTFVASMATYNDPSYARDSALRSSIGHGSTSTSSSYDFTSARLVDNRVQRQLSGKKLDVDNYRYDSRPHSSGSSLSGTPNHSHQTLGLATSSHGESAEVSVGDISEWHESSGTGDVCTSDLSGNTAGFQLDDNSKTEVTDETHLHEDGEGFRSNARSVLEAETEVSANPSELSVETDKKLLNNCPDGQNVSEVPTHRYLASISEIEAENSCQSTPESENGDMTTTIDFQDPLLASPSDKNNSNSVMEWNNSNHEHGASESTVLIECLEGSKARSLTLEEATDTILFCSSIVHDLAYQAATIAIEKENSAPLEDCRPTITVVEKPAAGRRDQPRGKTTNKRNSKSQKVRHRRVEKDVEPLSPRTENDENANSPVVRNVGIPDKMDSAKPMKLESKCNCTIM